MIDDLPALYYAAAMCCQASRRPQVERDGWLQP